MARRPRLKYTSSLKAEIWDRYKCYKPKDPSKKGFKTRLDAAGWLVDRFAEIHKANLLAEAVFNKALLVINSKAEVIRLKNEKKKLIDYPETADTEAMRRTVNTFNEYVQSVPVITLHGIRINTVLHVYRVFNNSSFDQGGRFFRGFWQYIRSEERPMIMIDGEPVVELDYASLHLAALYNLKLSIEVPKVILRLVYIRGRRAR